MDDEQVVGQEPEVDPEGLGTEADEPVEDPRDIEPEPVQPPLMAEEDAPAKDPLA